MKYKKVMLKVVSENEDRDQIWVHFCYVPKDMYDYFVFKNGALSFTETISRWAKEDFNFTKPLSRHNNIESLRKCIKDKVYVSDIGTTGITKYWLCTHMMKELNNVKNN